LPGKEKNVPAASACGRETSRAGGDGRVGGSPEKDSFLLGPGGDGKQPPQLCGAREQRQRRARLELSPSRTLGGESGQTEPTVPGSVSPASRPAELEATGEPRARDAGRATGRSDPEERASPASGCSARPFLGYDWIAGLLDTNSSAAEKPDEYFAELQGFREANRAACVCQQRPQPEGRDHSAPEQDPELTTSSHQCVYNYRLNPRLFPVPVDLDSACPVCGIPRAQ
ncbi:MIIP protein, partial [Trogon melanurus]|nr:MIIP protein [Trogon melanurus]